MHADQHELIEHGDARICAAVEAGLADALTVHDAEGGYLYASPSFLELTGVPAGELVGANPFDLPLVHRDDTQDVLDAMVAALADECPVRVQYRLRRADGAYVWVESVGCAATVADETLLVVTTREVSHLESLLQGVEHERSVANALDEIVTRQRRFLTTVSHRARTPLTAVAGMVELLHEHGDKLDAERRDILMGRLRANTNELVELIAEVTDADRLTRSDVMLRRRVVDLHELVDSAIADLTGSGGPVINRVPAGATAVVDPDRVRHMLTILISNAFQHAGTGARTEIRADDRPDGIELVVEDDGPGVPAEVRDTIFAPFTHGSDDDHDPGAGLGLYIVAELAALHEGRVWVDDRPSGGSRFHLWLPRPQRMLPKPDGDAGDQRRASVLGPSGQAVVAPLLKLLRDKVGMESVYLSILDEDHQHVLATSTGTPVAGIEPGLRIPLADSYCARMVAEELQHVIGDTAADPVTANLPGTADGIASWVGVPVHLPSGHAIGSLCGASTNTRDDLPQSVADEFTVFAEILGHQLAEEGFVDHTAIDASGRVAEALTRPEALHPIFQPIIDLATGQVAGVEALLRATHDDRPVDLWFADAARAGLLVELETAAIELALDRLATLDERLHLAINVSPATVKSGELALLLRDAPLHRLVLELTEHADVEDYQPLRAVLDPLRAQGLRLAVDDVGTGFAGLGHLVQLRPDMIKVDHSLVTTFIDDLAHLAAVAGLVRMAEQTGADLVAEGVETVEVLKLVREIGFTHAQGYLLGRPSIDFDIEQVQATVDDLLSRDAGRPEPTPETKNES